MFIGKHDRSLDDKGRLVLPSGYRRSFEDAGGAFFLSIEDITCPELWAFMFDGSASIPAVSGRLCRCLSPSVT